MDLILSNSPLSNNNQEQSAIRHTYSQLSTMYCMLGDYFLNESSFKSLNLEILAQKWMDLSYDVREAAQALLKNELKRIGPNGRLNLIKLWEEHLITLLKEYEDTNNNSITFASSSNQDLTSSSSLSTQGDHPVLQRSISKDGNQLNRIKTKQYIAIIILGILGAEFGQDVNTSLNNKQAKLSTNKIILQGFSIEDHSILKRVSVALTKLLTNRSLQNDVHRRASIDLIGRGFNIWEPFIQPTFVILSLLDLCAEADAYIPK
jgi:WD repeat-containing protein 7